jgi:hypothetical protein
MPGAGIGEPTVHMSREPVNALAVMVAVAVSYSHSRTTALLNDKPRWGVAELAGGNSGLSWRSMNRGPEVNGGVLSEREMLLDQRDPLRCGQVNRATLPVALYQ